MRVVEPIRNRDLVASVAAWFKKQNVRNYIMFMMGIYSGLRISDILQLRIKDVKGKKVINLKEKKSKKFKHFVINDILAEVLEEYCIDKKPEEMLISHSNNPYRPITPNMAYRIMRAAAKEFGLDNIGTHTMRKTFGYWYHQQYHDIKTLQLIFNHYDETVTERYIGNHQERADETMKNLKIF